MSDRSHRLDVDGLLLELSNSEETRRKAAFEHLRALADLCVDDGLKLLRAAGSRWPRAGVRPTEKALFEAAARSPHPQYVPALLELFPQFSPRLKDLTVHLLASMDDASAARGVVQLIKWYAGVSGPYRKQDAPHRDPMGDTFSTFEPWDSKTPKEHIQDVMDLLDEWRESRST